MTAPHQAIEMASCRDCRTEMAVQAMPATCEKCGAQLRRHTKWVSSAGLHWSALFPRGSTQPARKGMR